MKGDDIMAQVPQRPGHAADHQAQVMDGAVVSGHGFVLSVFIGIVNDYHSEFFHSHFPDFMLVLF